MQIIDRLYEGLQPLYPIEHFCDEKKALFVDIETTGLKKETTSLYLIGCGFYTRDGFMTRLFFADCSGEEYDILAAFSEFIRDYTHLFHFNGIKFDIPYLEYKADFYKMPPLFDGKTQMDVYKMISPLRYLLFPDSMRQKAVEAFLGIERDDKYGGGELISVYRDYEAYRRDSDLLLLITHNREDVLGMHLILPILHYLDLKDAALDFKGYSINSYCDYNGDECEEVIFEYTTPVYFPRSFTAKTQSMYLKGSSENKKLMIRLPVCRDDMKLFFDNYRDYCYLPYEDRAIHSSVACFLPKDRYVKATRQTCYRNVSGRFLKQPGKLFTPLLRTSYKDKKNYFRFPEDFKKEAADEFGRELINVFFTMKRSR